MLLDVTLSAAIELVGHRHGTRTKELLAVLRAAGRQPEKRLRRKKVGPPQSGTFLLCVRKPPTHWRHWAVLEDGIVYDPAYGAGPLPLPFWEEGVRVTSFLEVCSG